jgi:gliding motility-associated-like protein
MRHWFQLVVLIFMSNSLICQNYELFGDAFGVSSFSNNCPSDTCFTLTPDLTWKIGAVYSDELFDLTQPFDGTFCLFLGTKDATGADGFAFVLKDTSTPLIGGAGGGIGYGSLSPSVAIEFDTWNNGGNDIAADHTSLNYNGDFTTPIVSSIPLSASFSNVEDGLPHTARIVWTPNDTTLYLFFDNVLRFSHQVDLVNSIFGGKTKINWGFTCSTGGSANLQQICFPEKPIYVFRETICEDECLTFNQVNYDPNYSYTWSNGIIDTVPFIQVCPSSSNTYFLYKQSKLTSLIDTIELSVDIELKPILNLGKDTMLCNPVLILNATINNGINYTWNDGTKQGKKSIRKPGIFWVESSTQNCKIRDTIKITCIDTLNINRILDSSSHNCFVPNSFSPNNDGKNDIFYPILSNKEIFNFEFKIFNRWGEIIYLTHELEEGWDGSSKSNPCKQDIYIWIINYQPILNPTKKFQHRGRVYLKR